MSIGTILLIAGALGLVLVMHRVSHGARVASHGTRDGDAPNAGPDAGDQSAQDGHSGTRQHGGGREQKKHGC